LTESIRHTNKNYFLHLLIYPLCHELLAQTASLQTEPAIADSRRTSWPTQEWAGGKKFSGRANASQVSAGSSHQATNWAGSHTQLKRSRSLFLPLKREGDVLYIWQGQSYGTGSAICTS